jgi:ABC-type transport system involved in multi-copper enzyme maturation permease subunit
MRFSLSSALPDAAAWFRQALQQCTRVLGPIFRIETLLTVRRARYYLLRATYGSLLLFILWSSFEGVHAGRAATLRSAAEFAMLFFYSFASVQLIVAIVVTVAVTAGTIAEERERRTIEYLFATDLSNSEIVLGKLAARVILVGVFMLAGLPILSTARLFGGIDAENLIQLLTITLSSVVFAGSLSILISVSARRPRDAIMRAFIILVSLTILPWFSLLFAMWRPLIAQWLSPIMRPLLVGNPFVCLIVMSNGRFPLPGGPAPGWLGVWEMVRNQWVASFVMVALAVWRVRRVHFSGSNRDAPAGGRSRGWLRRRRRVPVPVLLVAASTPTPPRPWRPWHLRSPSIGNHPMLWKELFAERAISEMGPIGRFVVVVLFLAILAPVFWHFCRCLLHLYDPEYFETLASVLTMIIGSLFLLVIAARSATSVTTEKERDCWETLMSTPLDSIDIVLGKSLGSIFAMRWLIGLYGMMWLMAIVLRRQALQPASLMTLALVAMTPFFVSLGLLLSMVSRTSTRAMCWSLLCCLFVGGGYLIIANPVAERLRTARVIRPGREEGVLVGCAPYLVAWPTITQNNRSRFGPGEFGAGLVMYATAGGVLFLANVLAFDRFVGRARNARRSAWPRVQADQAPARPVDELPVIAREASTLVATARSEQTKLDS